MERAVALAAVEGVSATVIAKVSEEDRLVLSWRGERIVDLPRSFIQSNGAARHAKAFVPSPRNCMTPLPSGFAEGLRSVLSDLNVCSKCGLCERFDSTVGGNTILMPFGGGRQRTPIQAMAAKIPLPEGGDDDLFRHGLGVRSVPVLGLALRRGVSGGRVLFNFF